MGKIIYSPHDKMFKAALKNKQVAREYFQKHLPPEVLQVINLDVLEPCPEIYINEHLALSESDVVYKTEIAGEMGYLCLAAEHQSTDEHFMAFRMLKYDVAIWQFHWDQHPKAKKLPLIINIVLYTGKQPYKSPTDFKALLDAPKELVDAFWNKPFLLVQTQAMTDAALLQQKWAGLFLYFMKHIYVPDLLPYLPPVLPLMKAIDAQNGVNYLEAVSEYALAVGEFSDVEKFINLLKHELSAVTGEKIMRGAEQLIEIGKQQGEHNLFLRQLKLKFSSIPENYQHQIEGADEDQLILWSKRFITANTLQEIFTDRE